MFFYRVSRIVLKRLGVTDITPLLLAGLAAGSPGRSFWQGSSVKCMGVTPPQRVEAYGLSARAREQLYQPKGSAAANTSIRLFPDKGSFIECIRTSVVTEQDMGIFLNACIHTEGLLNDRSTSHRLSALPHYQPHCG